MKAPGRAAHYMPNFLLTDVIDYAIQSRRAQHNFFHAIAHSKRRLAKETKMLAKEYLADSAEAKHQRNAAISCVWR